MSAIYTTDIPQSGEYLVDAMHRTMIGQAAELTFAVVADKLSCGRRFLNQRLPDRNLIGFCDGKGNVLGPMPKSSPTRSGSANIFFSATRQPTTL
jgi:hypothetical protein